jgi:hypothetical protein
VTGHHRHGSKFIEEAEAQAMSWILGAGLERQTQTQERVDQPMLCAFDRLPLGEPLRIGQIGDHLIVAAGAAVD